MFMSRALICSLAQGRRIFHVRVQILLSDIWYAYFPKARRAQEQFQVFFVLFCFFKPCEQTDMQHAHAGTDATREIPVSVDALRSLF